MDNLLIVEEPAEVGEPDSQARIWRLGKVNQAGDKTATMAELFEPLIDSEQAATLLGCHPKTLQRYARQGKIPGYLVMGHWQFRATELDAWLRSQVKSVRHPCRMNRGKS